MHSEKYYKELNKKLLDEAQTAGLFIIEDKINRRGGVCRLDDKIIVIYDKNTVWQERNRLIIEALELAGSNLCNENKTEAIPEKTAE
ncbi:MAG TPA: hypothetical protein VIS94_15310 [Desulfomonilia bacterium]